MREVTYTVLLEPAEEGGFVVRCPALPGLVTEGDTFDEAIEHAKEAVAGYLESLQKDGEPLPHDLQPVKKEIRVQIAEPA